MALVANAKKYLQTTNPAETSVPEVGPPNTPPPPPEGKTAPPTEPVYTPKAPPPPVGEPPKLPGPEPGPSTPKLPDTPTAPRATGNYQQDILGFLRQFNGGVATPDNLRAALSQLQAMYPGLQLVNNGNSGKIQLPNGQIIDIGNSFSAGGGGSWDQWMTDNGGTDAPSNSVFSNAASMGFLPPMSQMSPISMSPSTALSRPNIQTSTQPSDNPLATQVQQRLMELLSRSTSPSATDPEIALPMNAFRTASQRGAERERADLAERASYEGWSGNTSGAFQTGVSGINQRRGESEAQYEAGLYQQQATQRMSELQSALALGANIFSEQERNQIQREITQIQTQLEQQRLAQNQSQFLSSQQESGRQFDVDASLRQAIEEARLRQQAVEAMLSGGR